MQSIAWILLFAALPSKIPERDKGGRPHIRSETAIVRFADTGEVLIEKNADFIRPIASITKLVSALLLCRDGLPGEKWITIEEADKDRLKWSRSKLPIGRTLSPLDLLTTALVISENRAVYALVRASGASREDFVVKMNDLARDLAMSRTTFKDPAGVDPANVSTGRDLLRLIDAVAKDEAVRPMAALDRIEVTERSGRTLRFGSTNRLAHSSRWDVLLGKTGYTVEAGRTLVLRVSFQDRPLDIVLLGSREMQSVFGDAGRIRRWLEQRYTVAAGPSGALGAAMKTE